MRALTILLICFLSATGVASAQTLEGKTAVMTIRSGLDEFPGRIYISRGTLFARFGAAAGGGLVCPIGGSMTVQSVCTNNAISTCPGAFLDLRVTGNIETTNASTCSAARAADGEYCATIQFVEASTQKRRSYNATGVTQGCVTVHADGSCSFTGSQQIVFEGETRPVRYRYRSSSCEMVEGRHL